MTFLFITLGYHPDMDGGAYRYASAVASGLASVGHNVEVLTSNTEGALPEFEVKDGVAIYRVAGAVGQFGGGRLRSRNEAMKRRLTERCNALTKATEPPIVISHHAYYGGALLGMRPWVFFHGPWGLEHRWSRQLPGRSWLRRCLDQIAARRLHSMERRYLDQARGILVASEYIRSSLNKWHPGLGQSQIRTGRESRPLIEVVGGGVDLATFQPPQDRGACRRAWGLEEREFLWLAVRRLDPRMGLDRLLEAFGRVASKCDRARLWMAGRGPQEAALKEQVSAMGLGDKVRFLGFVDEAKLPGLYGAADGVVMPSVDLEGFGLATVEALACGTPVLASDAGANRELLGELEGELIYNQESKGALEGRMLAVMRGEVRWPERARCESYAKERFGWDRVVRRFEQVTGGPAAPTTSLLFQ